MSSPLLLLIVVVLVESVVGDHGPRILSSSHKILDNINTTLLDLSTSHILADNGDSVELRCVPGFGAGAGAQWVTSEQSSDRVQVSGQLLTISSAKFSDTGVYSCRLH